MNELRTGVAIDADTKERLSKICADHSISYGLFLSAMVNSTSSEVQAEAIGQYRQRANEKKKEAAALRKQMREKLKTLTAEEIDMVLKARVSN